MNVVQLKIAEPMSDESAEVCSDSRLKLKDGPLLYYDADYFFEEDRNRNIKFMDCPLKGTLDFSSYTTNEMTATELFQ